MRARIFAAAAFLALLIAAGGFSHPHRAARITDAGHHLPHTLLLCVGTLGLLIIFRSRRRAH
jgi:hypothetical protein